MILLSGGNTGVYFTPLVSETGFERLAIETIKIMKEKPRFVLGVADQVPQNGLKSLVKKVGQLCEKYGKY